MKQDNMADSLHSIEKPLSKDDVRAIRRELKQVARDMKTGGLDHVAYTGSIVVHAVIALLMILFIAPVEKIIKSKHITPFPFLHDVILPAEPEKPKDDLPERTLADANNIAPKLPVKKTVKKPKKAKTKQAVVRKKPEPKKVAVKKIKTVAPTIADNTVSDPPTEPVVSPDAVVDPTAETEVPQGNGEGNEDSGSTEGEEDGTDLDLDALLSQYRKNVARVVGRTRHYPRPAARAHIEGRVIVKLVVDDKGKIISASVFKSSGHSILDRAALRSIKSMERLPAPPAALSWTTRALHVPFDYRLS